MRLSERSESLTSQATDGIRQVPKQSPASTAEQVYAVAGEKFISTISGQTNSNRLASQSRHQESRDLGGVGKRLVIDAGQHRDDVTGKLRGGIERSMLSP